MGTEMLRTEDGVTERLTVREAMREISHAQMSGKVDVDEMFGSGQTWYIKYVDGREVRFAPAPPAEEATENVVSVRGGKVHSPMPVLDDPYPLCRGGGMNQMLTKFQPTTAPITCKTCITYERRRRAAREGENG